MRFNKFAVGTPIPVEKNENPSQKEIDDLHEKYMNALATLFDTYKVEHGYGDKSLQFV